MQYDLSHLAQTRLFIGLVFVNGILGENKIEIVNKQIEQMDGIAIVLMKLFGSFSVGGNGQVADPYFVSVSVKRAYVYRLKRLGHSM